MKYDVKYELDHLLSFIPYKDRTEIYSDLCDILSEYIDWPGEIEFSKRGNEVFEIRSNTYFYEINVVIRYDKVRIGNKYYIESLKIVDKTYRDEQCNILADEIYIRVCKVVEDEEGIKDGYYEIQIPIKINQSYLMNYYDDKSVNFMRDQNYNVNDISSKTYLQKGIIPDKTTNQSYTTSDSAYKVAIRISKNMNDVIKEDFNNEKIMRRHI